MLMGNLVIWTKLQMEYWKMDIWKAIEFDFIKEEVEKFTTGEVRTWLMLEALATWSKIPSNIVYEP